MGFHEASAQRLPLFLAGAVCGWGAYRSWQRSVRSAAAACGDRVRVTKPVLAWDSLRPSDTLEAGVRRRGLAPETLPQSRCRRSLGSPGHCAPAAEPLGSGLQRRSTGGQGKSQPAGPADHATGSNYGRGVSTGDWETLGGLTPEIAMGEASPTPNWTAFRDDQGGETDIAVRDRSDSSLGKADP
jgi:hypothetical protein